MMKHNVEILAPAGSMEVFKVAVLAGADAIYCAGKSYGARAFAPNFTDEELKEAIDYAHLYNVKVFVTCNTVIFENEIEEVLEYIDFLYLNNCDGIIVQDLGLASIIKVRYPSLRLHASTQINAQTVEDCQVLKNIGFDRVILGREVSLETIKQIKEKVDIEIEVFIHGAICISYSGNCYFSSFIGGRSGNRGRCAQPCRKEYTFNNKKKYFLSSKDLCTIDNILEISKYCDSLKIEGRMKSKEYVYDVVTSYKDVLDNGYRNISEKKYQMQISFNRGYTKGFINNEVNASLTNCTSSNHQGVLIGEVVDSYLESVQIKLSKELKINDSIRIIGNDYEDAITINVMYKGKLFDSHKQIIKIAKANELITIKTHKNLKVGCKVYLTKRVNDFNKNDYPEMKVLLTGKVNIENQHLLLEISDGVNRCSGYCPVEDSTIDYSSRIKEQICKTGGTVYRFSTLDLDVSCQYKYVEIKEINNLRRSLLDELSTKRINKYKRTINDTYPILDIVDFEDEYKETSILVNNRDQLNSINQELVRNSDIYTLEDNDTDYLYLPRVTDKIYQGKKVFTNLGNLGKISSVYLNVCNSYTVRLLEHFGVQKIGLSIEMAKSDIINLIEGYKEKYNRIPGLEIMVFGRYQMMYMKHCFINKEMDFKHMHCHECQKNLYLDGIYPISGDSECHLTLYTKDVVDLTNKITELKRIGISHFFFDYIKVKENEKPGDNGYYGHYLKACD